MNFLNRKRYRFTLKKLIATPFKAYSTSPPAVPSKLPAPATCINNIPTFLRNFDTVLGRFQICGGGRH
ncbi:hypothetical protein I5M27_16155 [Adhaeribacter sp. BT258]|uniref:Uncharacterized protein n=1 Tax=Adhaeribacter terrigena TaxID=2793070 RepID=A0ABS1C558_9BACT|nr:hypothetical protein [Adhaeribacter terrigena]MBK0404531.1 hypothetical protein [Adhaeribacter terrigena]